MSPVKVSESNVIYAGNQPQYLPLPAYRSEDGLVITCWELSFKERIKLLLSGKLFLAILTFNNPLQPLKFGFTFNEVKE